MARTFTYSLSLVDLATGLTSTGTLVVQTADAAAPVNGLPGQSGYAIGSITGTLFDASVSGEIGQGGTVAPTGNDSDIGGATRDNTIFPSDASGSQGSRYGIDSYGVEFSVGNFDYLLSYNSEGGLFISGSNGTAYSVTVDEGSSNAPCYCRGTRVLTDRGEVAVEDLAIGDRLVTLAGAARPIRWIGTRAYSGRFLAGNRAVLPVLFRPGSLGDGVPRRDLLVSPKHAMFLDGVLVPAEALVNGVSVVQPCQADQVEYYHLELDSHDVILAEGAPSETFVDDDSRALFHNAHEHARLYPDAVPGPAVYCAPRLEDGYGLQAIQRRIAARATAAAPSRRRA